VSQREANNTEDANTLVKLVESHARVRLFANLAVDKETAFHSHCRKGKDANKLVGKDRRNLPERRGELITMRMHERVVKQHGMICLKAINSNVSRPGPTRIPNCVLPSFPSTQPVSVSCNQARGRSGLQKNLCRSDAAWNKVDGRNAEDQIAHWKPRVK
jgi:hypothetical protein